MSDIKRITEQELLDAGWRKTGPLYVSPHTDNCLTFHEAAMTELFMRKSDERVAELLQEEPDL